MTIRHRAGAYPIVFTSLEVALQAVPAQSRVAIDHHVASTLTLQFPHRYVVPSGEASKSLEQYTQLLTWLAESGMKRGDTLIAIGGGVVGDLVGFAASTYMRGVNFIQIPTTLLAMVDSSVGGKVGIDLPHGKNLVGAFKAPHAVYVCPEFLGTLPDREFRSGIAEVIKTGLIMDAKLTGSLESNPAHPGDSRLPELIKKCIQHKAFVVERDEFETSGLRATLNFGHTVGHAIEKIQGYSDWTHGEAIAAGMVAEAYLAEVLGVAEEGLSHRVEALVTAHGLPGRIPVGVSPEDLIETMKLDKKASRQGLAFSLVSHVGTCKLFPAVEIHTVQKALEDLCQN